MAKKRNYKYSRRSTYDYRSDNKYYMSLDKTFSPGNVLARLLKEAQEESDNEAKEASILEAIRKHPFNTKALEALAELRVRQGRYSDGLVHQLRAFIIAPSDSGVCRALAIISGYAGETVTALYAARRWVELEPNNALAANIYAGLLGNTGYEEESARWAAHVVRLQPIQVVKAKEVELLRVLVLKTKTSGANRYNPKKGVGHVTEGHNNLSEVLDSQNIRQDILYVDILADKPGILQELSGYDVILNSITDPVRCQVALERAEEICKELNQRDHSVVLNEPYKVLQCTRENHAHMGKEYSELLFPKAVSLGIMEGNISDSIRKSAQKYSLTAPIIMRAAGYQGGKNMHLLDDLCSLNVSLERQSEVQLLEYRDVGYSDPRIPGKRIYPKYRAMLVGETLYPIHLVWGVDTFNVHVKDSREAERSYPFLLHESQKFVENPQEMVGGEGWAELSEFLKATGFDYVGVDFGLSTETENEGKIIIFEANSAMRNWIASLPESDPVQWAWVSVTEAVHHLLCEAAGKSIWSFELPSGLAPNV